MGFWIFMLCMAEGLPVLMMIFGVVFMKYPPEINNFYGYRTRRSMKDRQTWEFAQRYWGRCALYTGLAGLVPLALCMLPCLGGTADEIGIWGSVVCVAAGAAVIGLPVFLTERALKSRYY